MKQHKRITAMFMALTMVLTGTGMASAATLPQEQTAATEQSGAASLPYELWYNAPAEDSYSGWENYSLPIGNSAVGGNVFGRYDRERVSLNEKSFWTGGPSDARPDYMGGNVQEKGKDGETLKQVQELFLSGDTNAGTSLCNQLIGTSDGYGGYQLFGNLYLDFGSVPQAEITGYRRALDVMSGIATVAYERGGTRYAREYLTSYPDNVMAIRLTAQGDGTLDFDVEMTDQGQDMGNAPRTGTIAATDSRVAVSGTLNDNQLHYAGLADVKLSGGGTSTKNGSKVRVSGAKDVTIILSMATDYKNNYPVYRTGESADELTARVEKTVSAAAQKGYDSVRENHLSDLSALLSRVSLDLGQTLPELPTDRLLAAYKSGSLPQSEKSYLEVLLYQYGRYLLASSSRGDTLPANLQGMWVGKNGNPWSSDYHMNVNLQMNYWPAYSTNLTETALPLIDYIDSLREPGRVTAEVYFGVKSDESNPENGFAAHTQNTPFGWTCPGWSFDWGWSPAAVPWILQNVWEYYEYTGDTDFMAENIYPMMKEEVKFYQQTMRRDENGKWISTPAYSPEQGPRTNGNTYEQSLVWQLLTDTITAAKVVGEDQAQIAEWETFLSELRTPIEIGTDGQVKEWYHETSLGSVPSEGENHRHLSHMLGLFPGDLISEETPEWYEAARVSMQNRVDQSTGWAMGQRINTWARLGDGSKTYELIGYLMGGGILNNLWDTHTPFQIDGNFGYTAGVTEALMQSNMGYINLLPALPDEWKNGGVDGIVARGNFELAYRWQDGKPYDIAITSRNGGDAVVQFAIGDGYIVRDAQGNEIKAELVKDNRISFETTAGETYTIENKLPIAAPGNVQVSRVSANQVDVSWDAVAGATSYNVYRSYNGGKPVRVASAITDTTLSDKTAVQWKLNDAYTYAISAVSANGNEGDKSAAAPEASVSEVVTIDSNDASVVYNGSWNMYTENNHYKGTNNCSWSEGATAELTFTGTGIELYSVAKPNYNAVNIYIDGIKQDGHFSVNSSAETPNMLVYSNKTLTNGEHTIKVEVMDSVVITEPNVRDVSISIDYFKVYQDVRTGVESVSVQSPTGATLLEQVGQSIQLTAETTPQDAANCAIQWSIAGDTELAEVDQTGLVTAIAEGAGTVTVTAEAADGSGAKDTFAIAVATNHTAAPSSNYLIGKTFTLTSGTNLNNYGPEYLTDGVKDGTSRLATQSSSNELILDVDLGEARTIDKLDIYERVDLAWDESYPGQGNPRIQNVSLQIPDGDGFITVAEGWTDYDELDNNTVLRSNTFDKITASSLRLVLTKDAAGDGITIWEIEAFGTLSSSTSGDKTELGQALNDAALCMESDFAADGWQTFTLAREAAIAAFNDASAAQDAIDSACAALREAMDGLVLTPSLTGLAVSVPSAVLPVGETMSVYVLAQYDRGSAKNVSLLADYSAADSTMVSAQGNKLTGVAPGSDVVTVTYTENGVTQTEELTIQVEGQAQPAAAELTVTATAGGSVTRSANAPYIVGQQVTLTAVADSGYHFTSWDVDGATKTDASITVTAGTDRVIQASFAADDVPPEAAELSVTATAGGSVTRSANAPYIVGQRVTLTAVADSGYHFTSWDVDGATKTDASITVTAGTDRVIQASFAVNDVPPAAAELAVTATAGGSVTRSANAPYTVGQRVTLTAVADSDYHFTGWDVDGATKTDASITVIAGTDRVVRASFARDSTGGGGGSSGGGTTPKPPETDIDDPDVPLAATFSDVSGSDWYYEAVQYVVSNNLMNGVSSDSFAPQSTTTRAMVITMLYRMAGSPEKTGAGEWYDDAVRWAKAKGVSDGTNLTAAITREQLAAMLYRYAENTGKDVSTHQNTIISGYTDASKISEWAMTSMQWACGAEIMSGKTDGVLDPAGNATRAETATMFMRFHKLK